MTSSETDSREANPHVYGQVFLDKGAKTIKREGIVI